MGYKIQGAINKSKKYYIIYTVLWLFCVIVFVMPVGAAMAEASNAGTFEFGKFMSYFACCLATCPWRVCCTQEGK